MRIQWLREETILALDLYFKVDVGKLTARTTELVQASELMTTLQISLKGDKSLRRTPNSLKMKMMNFRALDESYGGTGLQATTVQDREVWNEFAHNKSRLIQTARAIRNAVDSQDIIPFSQTEGVNETVFVEGRLLTALHTARERNPKAVRQKKEAVMKEEQKLVCEVCGFDFYQTYGELGKGFIECHHIQPLAECGTSSSTTLNDLALVCSNCHRMLHRSKKMLSLNELRRTLNF